MMNPKSILKLAREKITQIRGWFFIKSKAKKSLTFNQNTHCKNSLDLITIAFNKDYLIKLQTELIKKFICDEITLHIVDNSSNQDTSYQLINFCKKNHINYYKLPSNPSPFPSISHGHALNWALQNIVLQSKNTFFGFLDHDIFPTKKMSIVSNLKNQAFYGHQQKRRDLIYLWPGFCFFDKRKLNPKEFNFLPDAFLELDTGGRIYKSIRHVSNKGNKWPKHSYIKIEKKNESIHDSCIEKIDDWIHLINGSGWKKNNNKKQSLGLNYIKNFQKS